MARPLLLDLFCGAGGAAMGYHRAGFDVLGVDLKAQPRYPFPFVQADALAFAASARMTGIAAIHGSPVCKRWSAATPAAVRASHPDLITPLRPLLEATGLPYVIENVPGTPLRPDIKMCGCIAGLAELRRERWFECGAWPEYPSALVMRAPCWHPVSPITVAGHGEPSGPRMVNGLRATVKDWRRVMGINWMTRDELAQAIPPAYTELIGRELIRGLV